MKENLIDSINCEDDFQDEIFFTIVETTDVLEKAQFIEAVRRKCQKVGRLREFNNLLKAWILKSTQLQKQGSSNKTAFTDAPLTLNCGKWIANDLGVIMTDVTAQGIPVTTSACPHPILPVERYINIDTDTEKVKLAFFKDGRWREVTVDAGTVMNKNSIIQLADRGVLVTSESAKDLVRYLSDTIALNAQEIPLYRSIGRLGWIDGDFIPYNDAVKYDGDLDFKSIYDNVKEHGDACKWLEHISELRQDINIRLVLAASFASPLIEVLGALPFILHLWGTTGFGKTVSLMVASSVWGNPEMGCLTRTMNMTANAMARTACFLYNVPFCADELQQIKQNWGNYDQLVMYLTEGIDRGRAKARGGVEQTKTWRNSFIFTGEEPITKGASGGGVKNRVIEIECENKIIKDGNTTANLVKANYGHAGKLFIQYLSHLIETDKQSIVDDYKKLFKGILEATDTTDKQALSMALMLLADKIACECIFDDEPLTIDDVKPYLVSESAVRVEDRAYDELVSLIARSINKFSEFSTDAWGRLSDDVATINKQVLEQELQKLGFDFGSVKKGWDKKGYIIKNSAGRYVHQTRVNGVRGNYIKIKLPDGMNFEEVTDDKDIPFVQYEQQNLTFSK